MIVLIYLLIGQLFDMMMALTAPIMDFLPDGGALDLDEQLLLRRDRRIETGPREQLGGRFAGDRAVAAGERRCCGQQQSEHREAAHEERRQSRLGDGRGRAPR